MRMACKFQTYDKTADGKTCSKPMCKITHGECQFTESQEACSI